MKMILNKIFKDKILMITWLIVIFFSLFKVPKIEGIDFKTVFSLLNLLIVVKIMEQKNYLHYLASKISNNVGNSKKIIRRFVLLSFFSSMVVTNDIAILTLIPIFLLVSGNYNIAKIYPVTLITIAANLGSSVTPFGNPQNLFLFNRYAINLIQFFQMSIPFGILSLVFLLISVEFIPKKIISDDKLQNKNFESSNFLLFIAVVIFTLLGILSVLPLWISLLSSIIFIILDNKKILLEVDYSLILIFIGFFLAVNSISQIDFFTNQIHTLVNSPKSVYISSILISQIISNVPAAVLIANYTSSFTAVFLGVNVGGLGTIIASLANLIALKQYNNCESANIKKFFCIFSFVNIIFLALIGIMVLILL